MVFCSTQFGTLFLQKAKPLVYVQIPNIYFGLGLEFGLQRIRDVAIVFVVRATLNYIINLSWQVVIIRLVTVQSLDGHMAVIE